MDMIGNCVSTCGIACNTLVVPFAGEISRLNSESPILKQRHCSEKRLGIADFTNKCPVWKNPGNLGWWFSRSKAFKTDALSQVDCDFCGLWRWDFGGLSLDSQGNHLAIRAKPVMGRAQVLASILELDVSYNKSPIFEDLKAHTMLGVGWDGGTWSWKNKEWVDG